MRGQYRLGRFDVAQIHSLVDDLHRLTVTWKKGNKTLEQANDDANHVKLSLDDQWVLRQMQGAGTVRPDKIPTEQQATFLHCLKLHGFYSAPKWGLGITLFAAYWLVLLLVVSTQAAWLAPVMLLGGLAVTIGLAVLHASSIRPVNRLFWWPIVVIAACGYMATAIYSLLALPLMINIMVNSLYLRVRDLGTEAVGEDG